MLPQCGRIDPFARGHDVRDQPRFARSAECNRRSPSDRCMACERRLDLTELDPETADLDLIVGTAEMLQSPVRGPPNHVAGPVHSCARHEWVGQEALRC